MRVGNDMILSSFQFLEFNFALKLEFQRFNFVTDVTQGASKFHQIPPISSVAIHISPRWG
jgi:hypothetical protein